MPVLSKGFSRNAVSFLKRHPSVGGALAVALGFGACAGGVVYWRPWWVLRQSVRAWLRLAGVRSRYIQLDSYRIHYLVGGRGLPLVLVHGLGGRSENWAALIPSLMRRGYQVFALDMLGFGQSDRPEAEYSIALQTEILRQFFDSQKLERADMGGWSMGGWVALKFALAYPERVRRMFLVNSAGINFDFSPGPGLFQPKTIEQAQYLIALLTPHAHRIPKFVARDLMREMRPTRPVVQRLMESMMAGEDLLDGKLREIRAPVLIVWGKQDALIPLMCGEEMHRQIPHSVLAVFEGAGHLAPAECSGRVLPEIVQFLQAEPPWPASVHEFAR